MVEIREIAQGGTPERLEEIFSTLRFPGVTGSFSISKEELFDGTWIYRFYWFDELKWLRIDEEEYTKIHALLADTANTFNHGDSISAQSKINKLVKLWKRKWDGQAPHGINPCLGRILPK